MPTLTSKRGSRVVEVVQGATSESLPTDHFQTTYEIQRFQLTPLAEGYQVAVARAIASRSELSMLSNGMLLPSTEGYPLNVNLERRIRALPSQTYQIELHWQLGRDHPFIYCLSPVINAESRPLNQHLYGWRHPDGKAQALCAYAPQQEVYQPNHDDPAKLIRWVAIYLACDTIQQATKRWIGPEASHNLQQIQREYGRNQCYCGSGAPLGFCTAPNHFQTQNLLRSQT